MLDRNIFITIEAAQLVVCKCRSGLLSVRHHKAAGEMSANKIQAKIQSIRAAVLAALKAACAQLLAQPPPPAAAAAAEANAAIIPASFEFNQGIMEIFTAGAEARKLPYIVTKLYEVLVLGSAWTALVAGCQNSTIGSKKMTDMIKKAPRLYHGKRALQSHLAQPLTELSYRVGKSIYITVAGAREIVHICNSGVVGKRFYLKRGETDAAKIMRHIGAIKSGMLLAMDAKCAAIILQQRTANRCEVVGGQVDDF